MANKYYIARVYNQNGCCYDNDYFCSLKAAKRFIVGSARATIIKCTDISYGGNFSGWQPVGDYVEINTGRKCDKY